MSADASPLVLLGDPLARPIRQVAVVYLREPDWQQAVLIGSGMFSVVSGWGSYAYSWNGFGEDFFGWFCGIDWGYLLERINPGDVFDRAGSVRRARELVGDLRREGVIDEVTRNSALEDLRDKGDPWTGPDDVLAWFRKERPDDSGVPVALSGLVEYRDVPACSRPNPNAEAYCRKGLPALQRALRLAREEGRL